MSLRRSLFPIVAPALAAGLCASCADVGEDAWQPPTVVRMEGCKQAQVVSPAYGMIFGSAVGRTGEGGAALTPAEDATYVPVRPGELLGLGDGGPTLPYTPSDGATLAFTLEEGKEPSRLFLDGKTVAVGLDLDKTAGWAWLREAPAEDLAPVRFLMLHSSGQASDTGGVSSETQQTALARLAEANPHVGLAVQGAPVLGAALEMFDPAWLSLGSVTLDAEVQDLLAAEPRLHTLMMEAKAETGLAFLSRLPHVRTLFLSGWKGEDKDTPPPALPTIPSLRSLIVFGSDMTDLAPIGEQPNLQELALVGSKVTDVDRLARMPGLRTLSLQGCKDLKDLSALSGLTHLCWLALPPETSQEQFATVCADHPDLEVLAAVPCENLTDLSPLARLRRLRVLTLAEMQAPLDPVAGLASLRLLGVDLKFPEQREGEAAGESRAEDAEARKARRQAVVRIMEANPDLAVVQVAPLCLGSGWILLLAPATAGAWWLARRRRSGAAGDDG